MSQQSRSHRQGRYVEYNNDPSSLRYGVDECCGASEETLPDYYEDPVLNEFQGYRPDLFAEPGFGDQFEYWVNEGITVVKVVADHAGDVQAAIDAAELAGPGSIVWFDAPFDAEIATTLVISERIWFVGHSRDPSETKLKRAVAAVHQIILRVNAGATMKASETNRLPPNRLMIRDIEFDGQDGAAALTGLRIINTGVGNELKYATVENCVGHNCTTYGFGIEGLTGGAMEDIVFDSCVAYENGGTGLKNDQGAIIDFQMLNCSMHDHAGSGAYLRSDFQNMRIAHCNFKNNGEYGLLIEETTVQSSLIFDCEFVGNGWQIGPSNPCGLLVYVESNDNIDLLTIKRCLFLQNGMLQPFTALDGDDNGLGIKFKVKSAEVKNVLIEECDFINNGQFGVQLHARDGYDAWIHDIVIRNCNFWGHALAGVAIDDLSGYAASIGEICSMTAIGNYCGAGDGFADAPTAAGYTPDEYTGAGHGGSGDASLSSSPFGYKKEVNEGETRYPASIVVTG